MKKHWANEKNLRLLYCVQGKTLQEIGDMYGVTRERIRQIMASYQIPRLDNLTRTSTFGWKSRGLRFKSLEDYIQGTDSLCNSTLWKYLDRELLHCAECGSRRSIHLHHIVYPAKSLRDISALCAVCHRLKHTKGLTFTRQLDLFHDYKEGMTVKDIAIKYTISAIWAYKVIKKLKMGWHTVRG